MTTPENSEIIPDQEGTPSEMATQQQTQKCTCGGDLNANGNCFTDGCWNSNSNRHNGQN